MRPFGTWPKANVKVTLIAIRRLKVPKWVKNKQGSRGVELKDNPLTGSGGNIFAITSQVNVLSLSEHSLSLFQRRLGDLELI